MGAHVSRPQHILVLKQKEPQLPSSGSFIGILKPQSTQATLWSVGGLYLTVCACVIVLLQHFRAHLVHIWLLRGTPP